MDFEKFVLLTEKYAPSFHFNRYRNLVADNCNCSIASFNEYGSAFPYGTVCIAYNFDFDVDDFSLDVLNLEGKIIKEYDDYDILDNEESVAVRLARLEKCYHKCLQDAEDFKKECEEDERKEREEQFGLPTISW